MIGRLIEPLHGILYEEDYVWLFILVTIVMGGGAAYLEGGRREAAGV